MHKLPALELSAGYKHSMFTAEAGLKTNYQEYYSLVYGSAGVETKGKLLLGLNAGIGWTFIIPQLDRRYDPTTKTYTTLKEGYTTDGIWAAYVNAKAGYEVLNGLTLYGSYSYSWEWSWCGVGVRLTSKN